MQWQRSLILALAMVFLLASAAVAGPLQWQWQNPHNPGWDLRAVTYGGGQFVAVGRNGTILTSSDGLTWQEQRSGTTLSLNGVAYGDGRYVAVGGEYDVFERRPGNRVILTSTDGITWQQAYVEGDVPLSAVAYGNGRFAVVAGACGLNRNIRGTGYLSSADGVQWSRYEPGDSMSPLCSVAFGNGWFIAISTGHDAVYRSLDGTGWSLDVRQDGAEESFRTVAYGGGRFVVKGPGSLISHDGLEWKEQGDLDIPTYLGYGNGQFVGVDMRISTSPDGAAWTQQAYAEFPGLQAVSYGVGRYVAVGARGLIMTSTDGREWTTAAEAGPANDLKAIAHGDGVTVAAGTGYSLLVSANGGPWRKVGFLDEPRSAVAGWTVPQVDAIAFGDGRLVAVGGPYAMTVTSTDGGATWQYLRHADGGQAFRSVAYGNGKFVALGWADPLVSADGITWEPVALAPGISLTGVAFGDGRFVASGQDSSGGVLYSSVDGVTWTRLAVRPPGKLGRIVYGNDRFVTLGVGQDGHYFAFGTEDGERWFQGPAPDLMNLRFEGGLFVGVAVDMYDRLIYTSRDGLTWAPFPVEAPINDLAYADGQYVAVGDGGRIMALAPRCAGFFDVAADDPGCQAVSKAAALGLLPGYQDGTFRPDAPITWGEWERALAGLRGIVLRPGQHLPLVGYTPGDGELVQTGTLVVAAAQVVRLPYNSALPSAYPDLPQEAYYLTPFVTAAHNAHLIGPDAPVPLFTGEQFGRVEPATRAEAATLLFNLMAYQDRQ